MGTENKGKTVVTDKKSAKNKKKIKHDPQAESARAVFGKDEEA